MDRNQSMASKLTILAYFSLIIFVFFITPPLEMCAHALYMRVKTMVR